MRELDGVWDVVRESGALPPLAGVRKRIGGDRGLTVVAGRIGVPFRVRGRELHYAAPLRGLVDVLEPDGAGGFHGRALLFGRTYGTFSLRRIEMAELKDQLVKHLDEAYALEQNVLRMLDSLISTTDDPGLIDAFEHHKEQTREHAEAMRRRLEAHGATPSMVREAAGIVGALMKMPLDMVRGDKAGRNARDAFVTEHLEIASYELLKRIARKAGDEETAEIADRIIGEEQAMAARINESWDTVAEQSLRQDGITV